MIGHRYSWLARVVQEGTSWCMPIDIERVATTNTDSEVGAKQVKMLDKLSDKPKIVGADSLYGNTVFLQVFLLVATVYALVRLRSNRVLYEEPELRKPQTKGRTRKHGRKFKRIFSIIRGRDPRGLRIARSKTTVGSGSKCQVSVEGVEYIERK